MPSNPNGRCASVVVVNTASMHASSLLALGILEASTSRTRFALSHEKLHALWPPWYTPF